VKSGFLAGLEPQSNAMEMHIVYVKGTGGRVGNGKIMTLTPHCLTRYSIHNAAAVDATPNALPSFYISQDSKSQNVSK
jgi:hypothetical protein